MTLAYYPPTRPALKTTRQLEPRYALLTQLSQAAWQLALRFGKRTTIHGLDRVLAARASRWERFVWLGTFICAFLGAVYVCLILSQRYNDGKFQTVVDSTRFPVYRISFPVITICNRNRLNWHRLEQAKSRFMANVTDALQLRLFERIVSSYDDISFGHFEAFERLRNEPTALLNHINFSLVVDYMTWTCDELLTDCKWRHFSYNCCEIFSKRRSKNGLCWAFNTLETAEGKRMQLLDPMWPWRAGSAGPMSGLFVRVLLQPDKHWPERHNEKSIEVMITEPNVWHTPPYLVPANTQTAIEIEPTIYFYDNDTRSVSSDQRHCVFDVGEQTLSTLYKLNQQFILLLLQDEHNSRDFKSLMGYIYMIENCQSECHQEYLVRYCNCTLDLLFPPGKHVLCNRRVEQTSQSTLNSSLSLPLTGQYRSCRAQDLLCLAENNGA